MLEINFLDNLRMKPIQNDYLQKWQENQIRVSIYLKSGIQLKGIITGFDEFTILMKSQSNEIDDYGSVQLIFKHSIATIIAIIDHYV